MFWYNIFFVITIFLVAYIRCLLVLSNCWEYILTKFKFMNKISLHLIKGFLDIPLKLKKKSSWIFRGHRGQSYARGTILEPLIF